MKAILKRLLQYYKNYEGMLLLDLFFAFLSASVALIIPLIIRYITYQVVYFEDEAAKAMILKLGIVMFILVLVELYSNYFIGYYGHYMGAKIEANMRRDIFTHYQKLSFTFFDDQKVGQLISRITTDLFDISELLHHGPEDLLISLVKIIGSFIILLFINVKLTLVAFAFVAFMLGFAIYFNRLMKRASKKNKERIAAINTQAEDSLAGIRVVKSFANEETEIQKFEYGNERFVASKKAFVKYMGTYDSGLRACTTLITVCVLLSGITMVLEGKLAITDLITFFLYINNFTDPVKKLVSFTELFQNGYAGFERFLEILNVQPDIADREGAMELADVKGDITFENVAFRYGEGEWVLSGLNMEVKAGEYVALVGSSGVGKTTLCSLIPRFYDVDEGSVKIDGIDVRDVTLKSLRDQIGIVQQDVYLFAGTVMENIRYGKPSATDEEVIYAAKCANAHAFIQGLKDGYDTDIGQRGVKLSGGQKQRLSIARVFLKNPPVLIFDEATSALDNESEHVVQQSLEKLAKNRTTFVIAHRLTTIQNAKRILVLTEEGIAESGTHEELLSKKGIYESLYHRNFTNL